MPHSVSPEPQSDAIMADTEVQTQQSAAPSQETATQDKMDLEDMFDDDDDDSQTLGAPSQEPMYVSMVILFNALV